MILRVALDAPILPARAESGLFDYRWSSEAVVGQRAIVPFGVRTVIGLIVEIAQQSVLPTERLRDALAVLDDIAPLPSAWFALIRFAAGYYQRSFGEVALPALPSWFRSADRYQFASGSGTSEAVSKTNARLRVRLDKKPRQAVSSDTDSDSESAHDLNSEQAHALAQILAAQAIESAFRPVLLYGVTGSGKTEVYLRAIAATLEVGRQALVLVPEINLTPQLEALFRRRLPDASIASLHSGLPEGERALQWLRAHEGRADVLLGTRLAVLASLPRLGLIVVDEEHDPSYKQHEGLRYSARDLAIVRARIGHDGHSVPIVLASATPALETWFKAEQGRYEKRVLTARAVAAASRPVIRLVALAKQRIEHGFTQVMRDAIADRLARCEPTLVFHNRRGYAPVLACGACGWISDCGRCSVHAVFHQSDGRLHCHHCGWQALVPRACPSCGNVDLAPLGRGTQRVEEALKHWFPGARIARIDRDSTRKKGSAATLLDAVHAGQLDILVGTQMLAKGHDFRDVTLVCVVDADSALYSHDFRAAERLFSNLTQVAGRAGRGGDNSRRAEVLIQTRAPGHPLFAALVAHDFEGFAATQLSERRAAGLPPFSYQAVLRTEARKLDTAIAALIAARDLGATLLLRDAAEYAALVTLYDPVPMVVVRIAGVERAQLVIESRSRRALQRFLKEWLEEWRETRPRIRWHVEVDPLEI